MSTAYPDADLPASCRIPPHGEAYKDSVIAASGERRQAVEMQRSIVPPGRFDDKSSSSRPADSLVPRADHWLEGRLQ
jgi:hypothetical protein